MDGLSKPAPAALVAHCTRAVTGGPAKSVGKREPEDVAKLVKWLAERDGVFDEYPDWVSIGMALKLELGDAGLDVWRLTFDDKPDTERLAESKWRSFSDEPGPQSVTLGTWLKRAKDMGFTGTVRDSIGSMFGDAVTQLAVQSGATTQTNITVAGAEVLAEIGAPRLDAFMNATATEPNAPRNPSDWPTLPDTMNGHPLHERMCAVLSRIFAMTERKTLRNPKITVDAMALLYEMEQGTHLTYNEVRRRMRLANVELPHSEIISAATSVGSDVKRSTLTGDVWQSDTKTGVIEKDNPDNVTAFMRVLGLEMRWNEWQQQPEIRGGRESGLKWKDWTTFDDTVVRALLTRAKQTGTRFCPAKEFLWDTLVHIAERNRVDPVMDYLATLESEWDKLPRLSLWLARVLNVPNNPYLDAVGRNIIGGMVRRIRNPGCKHDTTAIFCGIQGTNKSTMGMILADMGLSTLAQIRNAGTQLFSANVKLGDEAKELLQMLRGKSLVEFSEMAMRTTTSIEAVKAMLTNQEDEGRLPYDRAPTKHKRRNIFYGTSNNTQPLTDVTGNRRFLPIIVPGDVDVEWLSATIRQLVGEACALESVGHNFIITKHVDKLANERREEARAESPVEIMFKEWFAPGEFSENAIISGAMLQEACKLVGLDKVSNTEKSRYMKALGFTCVDYGPRRTSHWIRGDRTKAIWYVPARTPEGKVWVQIKTTP